MLKHKHENRRIVSTLLRAAVAIEFDNLLAHCDFLNKGLVTEQARFEDLVSRETAHLDDEEKWRINDGYSDDAWRLNDVFPALQATAVFLLAYGMFERTINEIARDAGRSVDTNLKLTDLSGVGIERAKNFLAKVCRVTAPFAAPEWRAITDFAKLRNVMAHASGELDLTRPDHKQVLAYCRKQKQITVNCDWPEKDHAEIELSMSYVVDVIKCFRQFLIGLCNVRIEEAAE